MIEDDAVWAETTSGDLLRQLFGSYPSLHDAKLSDVSFNSELHSMTMELDYEDQTAGDTPLTVRMQLIWTGVQQVDLSIDDPHLDAVKFSRSGDNIETRFETGFGIGGSVLSEGFEAVLLKVDPADREQEGERISIHYR